MSLENLDCKREEVLKDIYCRNFANFGNSTNFPNNEKLPSSNGGNKCLLPDFISNFLDKFPRDANILVCGHKFIELFSTLQEKAFKSITLYNNDLIYNKELDNIISLSNSNSNSNLNSNAFLKARIKLSKSNNIVFPLPNEDFDLIIDNGMLEGYEDFYSFCRILNGIRLNLKEINLGLIMIGDHKITFCKNFKKYFTKNYDQFSSNFREEVNLLINDYPLDIFIDSSLIHLKQYKEINQINEINKINTINEDHKDHKSINYIVIKKDIRTEINLEILEQSLKFNITNRMLRTIAKLKFGLIDFPCKYAWPCTSLDDSKTQLIFTIMDSSIQHLIKTEKIVLVLAGKYYKLDAYFLASKSFEEMTQNFSAARAISVINQSGDAFKPEEVASIISVVKLLSPDSFSMNNLEIFPLFSGLPEGFVEYLSRDKIILDNLLKNNIIERSLIFTQDINLYQSTIYLKPSIDPANFVHSYTSDLYDFQVEFDYDRIPFKYDCAIIYMIFLHKKVLARQCKFNILLLGTGCGILCSLLAKKIPSAIIDSVDIDEGMVKLGKSFFGLKEHPRINHHISDALNFIENCEITSKSYDCIIIDLNDFNSRMWPPPIFLSDQVMSIFKNILNEEGFLIVNSGFKSTDQRDLVESALVKLFSQVFKIFIEDSQNLIFLLEKKPPIWMDNWVKYTKESLQKLISENVINDIGGEEAIYNGLSISLVTNS